MRPGIDILFGKNLNSTSETFWPHCGISLRFFGKYYERNLGNVMMPPRAFIYDHQHQKYFQQKHITPRKIIILRQQFSLGTHQDNHNNKNQKYTIAAVSKSALQQTNCRSASFLGKINLCTLLIVETRFQGCMYYYCEGKDTLKTTPAEISFCCFGSPATLLSIYSRLRNKHRGTLINF